MKQLARVVGRITGKVHVAVSEAVEEFWDGVESSQVETVDDAFGFNGPDIPFKTIRDEW